MVAGMWWSKRDKMEIQAMAKQCRKGNSTDRKFNLLTTIEMVDDLIDIGLQLEAVKDSIREVLYKAQVPATVRASAEAAEKSLMDCWTHIDEMIDPMQHRMDVELDKLYGDQAPYKYIRVQIDKDFYKSEGKYSYLFEFPRQATETAKTAVWLPKQFCTKRKDAIEVRFYDNTTFRFFNPTARDQAEILNADAFTKVILDAKIHLNLIQGKQMSGLPEYVRGRTR